MSDVETIMSLARDSNGKLRVLHHSRPWKHWNEIPPYVRSPFCYLSLLDQKGEEVAYAGYAPVRLPRSKLFWDTWATPRDGLRTAVNMNEISFAAYSSTREIVEPRAPLKGDGIELLYYKPSRVVVDGFEIRSATGEVLFGGALSKRLILADTIDTTPLFARYALSVSEKATDQREFMILIGGIDP